MYFFYLYRIAELGLIEQAKLSFSYAYTYKFKL